MPHFAALYNPEYDGLSLSGTAAGTISWPLYTQIFLSHIIFYFVLLYVCIPGLQTHFSEHTTIVRVVVFTGAAAIQYKIRRHSTPKAWPMSDETTIPIMSFYNIVYPPTMVFRTERTTKTRL